MIRNIKNWLGIEGVKIKVEMPPEINLGQSQLKGVLVLSSLSDQKIKSTKVQVIERFQRGTGQRKRTTDFSLAQLTNSHTIELSAEGLYYRPFCLDLNWPESEVDQWQKQNKVNNYLGVLAKRWQGVESRYFLEVNLEVSKTKLQPYLITELPVNRMPHSSS